MEILEMLKKAIILLIQKDKSLMARIAEIRKVEFQTVERWLNENHSSLMHILILEEIGTTLKKPVKELYEYPC